jgi:hypothetical protein
MMSYGRPKQPIKVRVEPGVLARAKKEKPTVTSVSKEGSALLQIRSERRFSLPSLEEALREWVQAQPELEPVFELDSVEPKVTMARVQAAVIPACQAWNKFAERWRCDDRYQETREEVCRLFLELVECLNTLADMPTVGRLPTQSGRPDGDGR